MSLSQTDVMICDLCGGRHKPHRCTKARKLIAENRFDLSIGAGFDARSMIYAMMLATYGPRD